MLVAVGVYYFLVPMEITKWYWRLSVNSMSSLCCDPSLWLIYLFFIVVKCQTGFTLCCGQIEQPIPARKMPGGEKANVIMFPIFLSLHLSLPVCLSVWACLKIPFQSCDTTPFQSGWSLLLALGWVSRVERSCGHVVWMIRGSLFSAVQLGFSGQAQGKCQARYRQI